MEEAAIEAAIEDELIHQWLSAGCRTGFGKSLGRETSERKNPVNFAPMLVTFKSHTHLDFQFSQEVRTIWKGLKGAEIHYLGR